MKPTGALLPKSPLRKILSGDGRQASFNSEWDIPDYDKASEYFYSLRPFNGIPATMSLIIFPYF